MEYRWKSNNNQKGFTMVELLASIVIMGLLAAVAIGAISFLLDTAEKRYYESLKKTVTLAGQSYYADNRSQLPKAIGDSRKVTLKTLIEKKYLEKVVDYGKKDCAASTGSYIKVFKYAKDKYTYTVYLSCPSYKLNEDTYASELKVNYKFNINSSNITASSVTADMSVTGDSKLASYTYTIYQNGKNVYTSDNIAAGYVNKLSKKINLKKYVPGNIKVGITLYDTRGSHKLFTSEEKAIYDSSVPKCGTINPKYDSWARTGSRKITVKCVNGEVNCLQKSFSKTFTEDAETGYITIKGTNADGSGRGERECPVTVMIDTKKPTCGTNTGSTSWTNEDREVSVECSDETSQCVKSSYSEPFTKTTKTANITIKDKAGNTQPCPVNVYVDKTPPKCGEITGASTTWTKDNRTITVACIDGKDESGCTESSVSKPFTTTTRTANITITDKAGNSTECPVNVYVDKTDPSCVSSGGSKDWALSRTLKGTCSDGNSGCKKESVDGRTYDDAGNVYWTINWDGSWTNLSPGTVYDKAGNSTVCPGNQTVNISTKPAKPTITNPTGGNWVKYSFSLDVKTTTASNLIGYWQYSFDERNWNTYDKSATNTFTTTPYSVERNQATYIRVCSKQDVCSDSASTMIRIDKTKPTLTYDLINDITGAKHPSGVWSRNGLYRHLYPADDASGVDIVQYNSSGDWITETNVESCWFGQGVNDTYYRVKDKAGNYSEQIRVIIKADWTPPVYTGVGAYCGDPTRTGKKAYVSLNFADTISGLGYRNTYDWDCGGVTVHFPDADYGGIGSAGDILATKCNWLGFHHYICDVAGNCSQWDDSRVNFNC